MYVQTVLDVHKKYNALVMSAFNNDAGFVAALDKVGLSSGGSPVTQVARAWPLTVFCVLHRPVVASSTTMQLPKWPSRPVNPLSCWPDTATPC